MATEHLCQGQWVPGKVADCPKHNKETDRPSVKGADTKKGRG